jgi:peptidoglycan hydrolase-like protein with peptidoglycan-binding domain
LKTPFSVTKGENKMRKNIRRLLYGVLFVAALSLFAMTAISSAPASAHAATSAMTSNSAETVATAKSDPPTLYYGSPYHVWVGKVQTYLQEDGYRGRDGKILKDDGIYGPNTEYAVKNLQRDRGLVPDGIVGPKTWHSIHCC